MLLPLVNMYFQFAQALGNLEFCFRYNEIVHCEKLDCKEKNKTTEEQKLTIATIRWIFT